MGASQYFSLCRNSLNIKRNAKSARPNSKREGKSKALQQLLKDFKEQTAREIFEVDDQVYVRSTEVEECVPVTLPEAHRALMNISEEDTKDDVTPVWLEAQPKLFLCDDWIMPVQVMKKPCPLQNPQDKLQARVTKNFLLARASTLTL